jgi:hypothetical protein
MKPLHCPYCDAALTVQETADGWCETCGKRLPPAVTAPTSVAGDRPGQSERQPDSGVSWFGKWLTRICIAGLLLSVGSCVGFLFVKPWLLKGLPDAQQDYVVGEITVGLILLAVGFGCFFSVARWFRR